MVVAESRRDTIVAIIVVFKNDVVELLALCDALMTAGRHAGLTTEVVLVINDGQEVPSREGVRQIVGQGNIGFAAGVRLGVESTDADFVVAINPDCVPDSDAFARFFSKLHPGCGIISPLIVDTSGVPDHHLYEDWVFTPGRRAAAHVCKRYFSREQGPSISRFMKIPGTFVAMDSRIARDLGPFDSEFFLYGEDRDSCRRARRRGIPLRVFTDVRVTHIGGVSGATVSLMVARAKADSALRVAYRRYGRAGLVIAAVDLVFIGCAKKIRGDTSVLPATVWAIKRWVRQSGEAPRLHELTTIGV